VTRAWITWTGLAVVALAAAVLSFDALRVLAEMAGTPATLAPLLPLTVDAAALVATRVWLAAGAPVRARSFARFLALGMICLSVAGNAVSHWLVAYQVTPPWWAVVAVAAVPPAVLGAVAHLAALAGRGTQIVGTSESNGRVHLDQVTLADLEPSSNLDEVSPTDLDSSAKLAEQPASLATPGEPNDSPGETLVDQARYALAVADAEGRKVGRATLARQLDCSEHQARQVLRQLDAERRPSLRAVGGEQS
jgi:hypothetical protein